MLEYGSQEIETERREREDPWAEFRKKPSIDSGRIWLKGVWTRTRNLTTSTMVTRPHSSAAGVLALLADPEPLLKQHALKSLVPLVPQFWAEISEHIALM